MRKLAITIAVAAAGLFAGVIADRAEAAPAGSPAVRGADAGSGLVQQVHCRPGRWHHEWRPHDGCNRRHYYRHYDDEPYYYRRGYHYGYGYGPGVGFRFGW